MGDQIGEALGGTLRFIPKSMLARIVSASAPLTLRASALATACRINALYMIARAGSGHIGSSFSSMEIMTWLHLSELKDDAGAADGNIFFSSKGHDAPALYSVMLALGRLPFDKIHALRRLNGLPGHPDVATPGIVTNTGSLGMGISKAKGMLFAKKALGHGGRVYVLTGDGELQEGQLWESLISAANDRLSGLTVIVDHNKLQSDTLVSKVSDLGDLEAKFRSFGWHVARCDGNDVDQLAATLGSCLAIKDRPQIVIADTVKGRGVSFMEHTSFDSDVELYRFHSGAPTEDVYVQAVTELVDRCREQVAAIGINVLEIEEEVRQPAVPAPANALRLIPAYGEALIAQARENPNIVALDADLILDTGLIPFRKAFPERFVECGIAEQDMVSQAGGMALMGLLPIVHSFGCFLTTRPNEQIYNNATERTKIIYVGSLSGLVPAGPGHSHQAVRDISAVGAIPGLTMAEPADEQELRALLDWAIRDNGGSTYLRLMSLPWEVNYTLPDDYRPSLGKGVELRPGSDVVIFGYGPVLLSAACAAAEMLEARSGVSVSVINLPWLNAVDADWLKSVVAGRKLVVALDNHYTIGGQADRIAASLATFPSAPPFKAIGLTDVPHSGAIGEVIAAHGMDASSICSEIARTLASWA